MAVLGLGLGATMQNLVLAVQNNTALADMGAASSVVAFFRSLGGSVGVAALGAVLAHQVADAVAAGLAPILRANPELAAQFAHQKGDVPDLSTLPGAGPRALRERLRRRDRPHLPGGAAVRGRRAGGVLLIKEVPLRTTPGRRESRRPPRSRRSWRLRAVNDRIRDAARASSRRSAS